jgi:translation elongation factor EF-1beta
LCDLVWQNDDEVSVDDLVEAMEAFEDEVQSVDINR